MDNTCPPLSVICFATASKRSPLLAAIITFAPSAASEIAVASPIPEEAPVTMATFLLIYLP
jgi:hypothetical protein